jgi:hypothetical protein
MLLQLYGSATNSRREVDRLKRRLEEADEDDGEDEGADEDEDAHRSKKARNEEIQNLEGEIKRLGRKLCIMHALWFPSSSHLRDLADTEFPDTRPDAAERYADPDNELAADQFDYFEILGERVYDLLTDPFVRRLVRPFSFSQCARSAHLLSQLKSGMNDIRQTIAHRINVEAREKIFPPEIIELSQEQLHRELGFRRSTPRKQQHWVLYDNKYINGEDYAGPGTSTEASIFRGDYMYRVRTLLSHIRPSYQMASRFRRVPAYYTAFAGLTHSRAVVSSRHRPPRSTLASGACGLSPRASYQPVPSSYVLSDIRYTTLTYGQVLFALSADDKLIPTGPVTGIPYAEHFGSYVEYLHQGLADEEEDIVALFANWNALFFPNGAGDATAGGEEDEEDDADEDDDTHDVTEQRHKDNGHREAMRRLKEARERRRRLESAQHNAGASGSQEPQDDDAGAVPGEAEGSDVQGTASPP